MGPNTSWIRALGLAVAAMSAVAAACQGPEEYFRGLDGGRPGMPGTGGLTGVGGSIGAAGTGVTGTGGLAPTGTAGSGSAGTIGNAGTTGSAGTTAAAGTTGSAGRGGTTGAAGRGGTTGTAGTTGNAGRGGTTGTAGTFGRGGTTGTAGTFGRGGTTGAAGTVGRGGTTGSAGTSGPGTVIFSDNFEGQTSGTNTPEDWARMGGSTGDWVIADDGTQVLQQNGSTSSTPRTMYANGASGAPWSGATTVSARVKLIATGSSDQAATVCVRFTNTSNYYCAAVMTNGVQIRAAAGGSAAESATWGGNITIGNWYDVRLSVDASNELTAYLGGNRLGSYTPAGTVANGYAAVGTSSMRASFDNVVVTRP